jgi:hypothetical protein
MFLENYRLENAELMAAGAEAKPIPYPKISEKDWRVWSLLLPHRSQSLDKNAALKLTSNCLYLAHGIPYSVATEVKKAGQYFDAIEVWRKQQIDRDPIAVGVIAGDRYLIARWGMEKLIPFETMKKTMPLVLAWKYATDPLTMITTAGLGLLVWGYLL